MNDRDARLLERLAELDAPARLVASLRADLATIDAATRDGSIDRASRRSALFALLLEDARGDDLASDVVAVLAAAAFQANEDDERLRRARAKDARRGAMNPRSE